MKRPCDPLKLQGKLKQMVEKTHEIIGKTKKGTITRRTVIHCTHPYYHGLINTYMELFVSEFSLDSIQIAYLDEYFLTKLHEMIHKYAAYSNWEKEKRRLELYTRNSQMTNLPPIIRNSHQLRFSPPEDFRLPKDFWNIVAIFDTKQLVLNFGGDVDSSLPGESDTVETDLWIDDNFITKLINDRKAFFMSNTISKVTFDFLLKCITSCLNGGYGLFNLVIRHNFDGDHIEEMQEFLLSREFVMEYQPDQFIVKLYLNLIRLTCDSAFYRGKTSIRGTNDSFFP